MSLLFLVGVLIVLYCCLYNYFTRNYNYWKNQNVLGPKPIPLFGNLKETALRRKNMSLVVQEFYNMFPKERVVGIYRMTTPSLLIRDLDIIKHIMIKDFDLFRDRGIEFSSKGLGQNIFHADGDTWSALRSRMTPIFTSLKLKSMFHLLNNCADMFITHLENATLTNQEHKIRSLAHKYTISTIFACAFGVNFNNFHQELDDTLKDLNNIILLPSFVMEIDMMYPGLLKKLDLSLFPENTKKYFDELVSTIMTQRNGKPSGRGDFMDLILQLREMKEIGSLKTKQGADCKMLEITDNIMAAQALAIFVGGNETSSTTLGYLFYQLALNPEIQNKLREEVDSVIKAHGAITYESLQDMKYLEKTFLETLRMYPIVDPLQRKADVDYKIPGTDVIIKKDQIVLVSALSIHYDKNYYPKPEIFDPHRFDSEVVGARHPCAYLPFGVGQRNCIGMRFGALQSRLCVAKIISKFRIEPSENTRTSLGVKPDCIIMTPKEEIYLNIIPRKF